MNKVPDVLTIRFSQNPLESYFCKQNPLGTWKDKLPFYDFGYANTFQSQKVFKPIATSKVRDENINFESDRTSSMSEKIKQNNPCYLLKFQAAIRYLASYQT